MKRAAVITATTRSGARKTTLDLLGGPLVTLVVACMLAVLQLFEVRRVPGLGAILLACVVFSVLRGGWRSGVASFLVFVAGCTWLTLDGTWRLTTADALGLVLEVLVTIPITIGIARLVTRLERAGRIEQDLRHSSDAAHARLAEILERITDGFFAVDRDWRCTYVNARAEQLVMRSRGELLGTTIWDAAPQLVGSAWDANYRHALASGEAVHFEAYYAPLDADFETHAYPSPNGLSIYLRDVTARARAERALRSRVIQQAAIAHIGQRALAGATMQSLLDDAVERLASVFDVDYAKVLEHQPDGTLLLRAGVGWQAGLVGSASIPPASGSQGWYTLVSGAPVIVEDLRTERRFTGPALLLDHGVVSGMSLIIPGPDGPFGILAVHSTRRRTFTDDDVAFLTGMAQVLALAYEWMRTTVQLRETQQRSLAAEAGAAARDEVLAIVTHDLRSPFATIVMVANALELDGANTHHTELIRRTVKHMLRLVQDLLEVSRLERGGELAVERAALDPAPLVRDVADAFALQATRRSIALDVRIAPALPAIFADRERIIQALENLMTNAIKFTPAGGRISLEAVASAAAVRISVADTGSGILPEHAASLFRRYWQARSDRRGIGIGLSVVKGIVDAHAGRVWVDSRPGEGSRFSIEIPAVALHDQAAG